MISAKFLWGNVFFGGKLQIDAKNSNYEIFENALYMKSVSKNSNMSPFSQNYRLRLFSLTPIENNLAYFEFKVTVDLHHGWL